MPISRSAVQIGIATRDACSKLDELANMTEAWIAEIANACASTTLATTPRSGTAVATMSTGHAAISIHDGAAPAVPSNQARALAADSAPKGTERTARSPASALMAATVHQTAIAHRTVDAVARSSRRRWKRIHGKAAASGSAMGMPSHVVRRTASAAHHPG